MTNSSFIPPRSQTGLHNAHDDSGVKRLDSILVNLVRALEIHCRMAFEMALSLSSSATTQPWRSASKSMQTPRQRRYYQCLESQGLKHDIRALHGRRQNESVRSSNPDKGFLHIPLGTPCQRDPVLQPSPPDVPFRTIPISTPMSSSPHWANAQSAINSSENARCLPPQFVLVAGNLDFEPVSANGG